MNEYSTKCPECGERLSRDARQCACGWGAKKVKPGDIPTDMQCQWVANGRRCRYPVGRFEQGMKTGKCVFHRNCGDPADGARIVEESLTATPEQYVEAAKRYIYGTKDVHAEFRKTLKKQKGDFADIKLPINPDAEAA